MFCCVWQEGPRQLRIVTCPSGDPNPARMSNDELYRAHAVVDNSILDFEEKGFFHGSSEDEDALKDQVKHLYHDKFLLRWHLQSRKLHVRALSDQESRMADDEAVSGGEETASLRRYQQEHWERNRRRAAGMRAGKQLQFGVSKGGKHRAYKKKKKKKVVDIASAPLPRRVGKKKTEIQASRPVRVLESWSEEELQDWQHNGYCGVPPDKADSGAWHGSLC